MSRPLAALATARRLPALAVDEVFFVRALSRAGVLGMESPLDIAAILSAYVKWGPLGAAPAIAARRHGDRIALVDERGELSFAALDRRANALANAWRALGLRAGDGIAILAHNHRGFLDATFACAKAGGRAIYLNTDFAGPQIREVAEREGARMLVHDDEYTDLVEDVDPPLGRWRAWTDALRGDTLDALIEGANQTPPPKPERRSGVVILTSGTTGTPKGAPRAQPRSLAPAGAILSKVPFRSGETTVLCAPMFHGLGLTHAALAMGLGSKLVLRRRFDPETTLEDLGRHRASALVVVPVMLQRILGLGEPARLGSDLSALRIVFVAGSKLGAELCVRATEGFGHVIYNLYGSSEVSYATIATPEDLAEEPGCVGRAPRGAVVRILDNDGREAAQGQAGRIFVGNATAFTGYTGGETKETIGPLMSTGDIGHLDAAGRLFVDGRDDEMIVSGGENVFPAEVEELLAAHEDIEEAAAIGVDDPDFGRRLRAFVVLRGSAELNEAEVKDYVRANLARYKVPREVIFLDELPRNATGKLLKRELTTLEP